MNEHRTPPTVEYWIRQNDTITVSECQKEVYRELKRFEDIGQIESVDVNYWNEPIQCPSETDNRTDNLCCEDDWETYCEFRDWATENGYELEPAFQRCELKSLVSAERLDVIKPPLLCLAVYANESLQTVFPYASDARIWTIRDGLAILDSPAVGRDHHLRDTVDPAGEIEMAPNRRDS